MANLDRTKGIPNKDVTEVLKSIEKREGGLTAKTLIPNQAFPIETTKENKPACIYFNDFACRMLDFLKDIHHKSAIMREKQCKRDTQLEFVCYGYRDHNGDIVICDIDSAQLDEISNPDKSINLSKLASYTPTKDTRIDSTARMFEYVRHSGILPTGIANEPVALLGLLRPEDMLTAQRNTPLLKEMADIVLPGNAQVTSNFSTGLLVIPPAEIARTANGYRLTDASMESLLIEHKLTSKNYAKPVAITNITKAIAKTQSGDKVISISQNRQNLNGLPIAKLNIREEEQAEEVEVAKSEFEENYEHTI